MINNPNKKFEEIDIVDLAVKIYLFLRRRVNLLIIFIVLGGILGITRLFLSQSYYKTQVIAHSTVVPDDILVSMINKLQLIVDEKDSKELSKELKIKPDIVSEVKSISASIIPNNIEGSRFEIKIEVYNNLIVDSVINGINRYIQDQYYIKKRSLIQNNQELDLISELDLKINELDSLQKKFFNAYEFPLRPDMNLILHEHKSFHKELIDLYEKKQRIEKQNSLSKEMEIIDIFQSKKKHLESGYKYIMVSMIVFLFLGLFLAIILEVRNKITSHIKATDKSNSE